MRSKFKDMIFVKGGKYTPCFTDDEKKVFDLEVCRYLTTQKIWLEVMNYNPSKFEGIYKPVDSVTWWEALEFCNKLSEKYNLEPVYDLSKKGILMINQLDGEKSNPNIADFKKTEGFRLPTEVEWEWFARGGQVAKEQGNFDYDYSGSDNIDEVAWYLGNSDFYYNDVSIKEVGLKKPNQLGLFDCSGNIWEWCYDTTGEIENGKLYTYKTFEPYNIYRRIKGGSGAYSAKSSLITNRSETIATYSYKNFGFRIVRTINF